MIYCDKKLKSTTTTTNWHTGIKNIQSLETTRRQLRCESSKNLEKIDNFHPLKNPQKSRTHNFLERVSIKLRNSGEICDSVQLMSVRVA